MPQPVYRGPELLIDKFAGLSLRARADYPGALDLLDVFFEDEANIRTRDGWKVIDDSMSTYLLGGWPGNEGSLIFGNGSGHLRSFQFQADMEPFTHGTNATNLGLWTDLGGQGGYSVAKIPGYGERTLLAGGGAGHVLQTGNVFAAIGATATVTNVVTGVVSASQTHPDGDQVCWWPGQERLATAGRLMNGPGATGPANNDVVWFSVPDNAFAYRTGEYASLGGGDGEWIQGMCAWRDLLFVFKETRFWVFTGTTVQGDGIVKFNRRAVEAGVGAVGPKAIAATRDGVYFIARDGVYVTRGGEPEKLSWDIEPLFTSRVNASEFSQGVIDAYYLSEASVQVIGDQVFCSVPLTLNSGSTRTWKLLVYDIVLKVWSVWTGDANNNLAVGYPGLEPPTSLRGLIIVSDVGSDVKALTPGQVVDGSSTKIDAYYLGNFLSPSGDRVARVRGLDVWGKGRVNVGLFQDHLRQPTKVTDVTLDSSATKSYDSAYLRRAFRGSKFALYLSTPASASWQVNRVGVHIAGGRHRASVRDAA